MNKDTVLCGKALKKTPDESIRANLPQGPQPRPTTLLLASLTISHTPDNRSAIGPVLRECQFQPRRKKSAFNL